MALPEVNRAGSDSCPPVLAFGEDSLYQHLVEHSETVFFVADDKARLTYLNRSGRNLLGIEDASLSEIQVWDLFDSGESGVVQQVCNEVLDQGRATINYRGVVCSTSDARYAVLADFKPLPGDGEETLGILGGLRDVSILSQAQQELLEQRERLDTILRSIGVGLVIVDRNRKVFYQNEIIEKRFGKPPDNQCFGLYGRSEPCENCILEQVLSGQGLGTTLVRGRDKQSRDSCVEILSSPVRDKAGEIIGALEVVVDVTEKNRLAERVNILAKVVENMQEGVVVATLEGRVIYANDSFAQQTQWSVEELEQIPLPRLFAPSESENLPEIQWRQRLLEGVFGEYHCLRREDDPLTVLLNTFQIVDERNRPNAVVGVSLDLTERKRLESDLIQSSKLAALGQLISGITHELNNPLGTIMGYSQLLLSRIARDRTLEVPEKVTRGIESILSESERATKIIQNMLSFSRRQEPSRNPVAIHEIIDSTLKLCRYDLKEKKVEVVWEADEGLPLLRGDANQLQQVFLNLINNSVQAVVEHGGDRRITIQTRRNQDRLEIRFQDTGPGVPPKNIHKVFDPFFTTKEMGKGTGLGLSICLGIIKDHGGGIQVQSPPGGGATFVIDLPIPSGIAESGRSALSAGKDF